MTAVGYISDMEDIVRTSWSLFEYDGEAAFKSSGGYPLPAPLSAKELHGGRTKILNACRIRRINCHQAERDEGCAPESISDTEDWLDWNGVLNDPNDSEDDCAADVPSDIEQDKRMKDLECPEQQDMSITPNVPRFILPTRKSKRQAEKVLLTVNAIETRMNKGEKKKLDGMR